MNHWKKIFPDFIYDIKYEYLISNTNEQIKNLVKFCNLNWSNKCLKFYKNNRVIKTASDFQAREKIYKRSINSWKNYKLYLNDFFDNLPH